MKFFKTATIIALLGVTTIVMLNANESCKFKHRGEFTQHMQDKHQNMRKIFKELDLSDEQKDKIKANRKEMRELIAKTRASLKADFIKNTLTILNDEQKEKFVELLNNRV